MVYVSHPLHHSIFKKIVNEKKSLVFNGIQIVICEIFKLNKRIIA